MHTIDFHSSLYKWIVKFLPKTCPFKNNPLIQTLGSTIQFENKKHKDPPENIFSFIKITNQPFYKQLFSNYKESKL